MNNNINAQELQAALLANMMGGQEQKKSSLFGKTVATTKTVAGSVFSNLLGVLPPTRNELRREVAQLESNDMELAATVRLVIERLEEYGIDLGIDGEDVAEYKEEMLVNYHLQLQAQKDAKKEEKKAARAQKIATFQSKAGFKVSQVTEQDIQEIKGHTDAPQEPTFKFNGPSQKNAEDTRGGFDD